MDWRSGRSLSIVEFEKKDIWANQWRSIRTADQNVWTGARGIEVRAMTGYLVARLSKDPLIPDRTGFCEEGNAGKCEFCHHEPLSLEQLLHSNHSKNVMTRFVFFVGFQNQ